MQVAAVDEDQTSFRKLPGAAGQSDPVTLRPRREIAPFSRADGEAGRPV